jgi:hypothetical protein
VHVRNLGLVACRARPAAGQFRDAILLRSNHLEVFVPSCDILPLALDISIAYDVNDWKDEALRLSYSFLIKTVPPHLPPVRRSVFLNP